MSLAWAVGLENEGIKLRERGTAQVEGGQEQRKMPQQRKLQMPDRAECAESSADNREF